MPKIFLSYRREDSAYAAQFLYERLRAHFGKDAVFMDIDTIPYGADFRKHIDTAVDTCDILLAVIGPRWTGATGTSRRIDDPCDFVRIEIESALKRNLAVIPILIDHARMPSEADLPPSLAQLAYHNAAALNPGRDFHYHVELLINGMERQFPPPNQAGAVPPPKRGETVEADATSEFERGLLVDDPSDDKDKYDRDHEVFAIDEKEVDQNAATAMAPVAFADDDEDEDDDDDGFAAAVSAEMTSERSSAVDAKRTRQDQEDGNGLLWVCVVSALLGALLVLAGWTGVVAWSWWIMLAPLWMPAVVFLFLLVIGLILGPRPPS